MSSQPRSSPPDGWDHWIVLRCDGCGTESKHVLPSDGFGNEEVEHFLATGCPGSLRFARKAQRDLMPPTRIQKPIVLDMDGLDRDAYLKAIASSDGPCWAALAKAGLPVAGIRA
jgi:hypothetical protein